MNIFSIGIRRWLGLALCGLPAVVLSGWLMGNEKMLSLMSGTVAMSLTAAILFIVAGACLLGSYRSSWSRYVLRFMSVVLVAAPALILLEHLIRPGLDPGSASLLPLDTGLALILSGTVFLIDSRSVQGPRTRKIVRGLVIAVLLIGGLSLFMYTLNLEDLYRITGYNRIAAPSALGICLLGLGLWFFIGDGIAASPANLHNEDQRITRIAGMLLTILAVVAGLTGFAVLQQGYEQTTKDNVQSDAIRNAVVVDHMLGQASMLAKSVSTRPALKKALASLSERPHNPDALAFVGEVARTLLPLGFSGIEFYNARGEHLYTTSEMSDAHAAVTAQLTGDAGSQSTQGSQSSESLLWEDGFVLRSENEAMLDGKVVGRIVTEQRLSSLTSLIKDLQTLGDSDDALLCTRQGGDAVCFPTRFFAANMHVALSGNDGIGLPLARALSGKSGAVAVTDIGGSNVMAAYAPVGKRGLGLVLKTGLEEQYALLRKQFNLLGLLLALLVVLGTFVLRKQLQPLVSHILQEQNRMKLILENSTDAFVMVGESGRIRDWNAQAERSLGWTREEVLGKRLLEMIIPPSQLESVVAHITHLEDDNAQGTVVHRRVEIDARRKDGALIPMEISIASLYDTDGYAGHVFLRDISERRKVDALKDEFISTVSHELRTPLTSIHGALGLILGGVAGQVPAQAGQLLTVAHRNSERLIRLINDILDIEKIESGNMSFVFKPSSLPLLIQQALELSTFYGQQYGVEFRLQQPVPDVSVNVDQDRLIQVMINLLSNAAKFSNTGSSVEISAQAQQAKVRVTVTDHGCGIPPESHDRIFQKFSQVDGSDRRKKGGTGLGLSICKSIIEQMQGTIGFASVVDEGSRFYFELPVIDTTAGQLGESNGEGWPG
ncbi:ATP-binding protein [Undibacterium sp.]|uniref:sensor histidine kinase n=1 Tax=Undibacterium sp. TaxID=1914977 RepID=UPI00374CAE8B